MEVTVANYTQIQVFGLVAFLCSVSCMLKFLPVSLI